MTLTPRTIGLMSAGLASALTALTALLTRALVQEVPAFSLTAMRYFITSIFLATLVVPMARRTPKVLTVAKQDMPLFVIIGFVSCTLFPLCYTFSLRQIPAGQGALLGATTPVWAAVISFVVTRDRLSVRQFLGTALTVVGVAVLSLARPGGMQAESSHLSGQLLMVLAAFFMALGGILIKRALLRYRATIVTLYRASIGALIMMPIALVVDDFFLANVFSLMDSKGLLGLVVLSVFGGALVGLLWAYSLARLPPTQALVFLNVSPIIAAALGVPLLGETLGVAFVLASALCLGGVFLCQGSSRPLAPSGKSPE